MKIPLSVKPYFLPLLLVLFLEACSNGSEKKAKVADTAMPAATADQTASQTASAPPPPGPDSPAEISKLIDRGLPDPRELQYSSLSDASRNVNIPPFGLAKVQAAMRKMHSMENDNSDETIALADSVYDALTLDEKFTYTMIHAENFSQNCDPIPERVHEDKRIYGEMPNYFTEYQWSERQLDFLKTNRDSVMQLLRAVFLEQRKVGMNSLDAIVEMNARQMIPWLIDFYRSDNSNHYILTALMMLMEKNKYPEFMGSISYNKLYGNLGDNYSAYLVYSKGNEDLIIQRATNFIHTNP